MDILNRNLRNKFLILTLCFTIIFSSLNVKKVDAFDFVISPTMLAVVSTLAVGTGIALKSSDDIYDIGRLFYDYVSNHNSLTWEVVKTTFDANVTLLSNGKVSVGSDFISICKDAFSNYFSTTDDMLMEGYDSKYGELKTSSFLGSIPIFTIPVGGYSNFSPPYDTIGYDIKNFVKLKTDFDVNPFTFKFLYSSGSFNYYDIYLGDKVIYSQKSFLSTSSDKLNFNLRILNNLAKGTFVFHIGAQSLYTLSNSDISSAVSIPYTPGSWEWDKNYDENKTGTGDLPLPIPGDLGNLLGKNPSDIWGNTDGLVGKGDLSIPQVDNPSIGIGGSTSFPTTDTDVGNPSIPGTDTGTGTDTDVGTDINTGIWATIKDFVVSLVVPSDTFWTDTWNGLYSGFVSAFPGVDMDNFNSLVTGEKKFPNIDINIMGVKGRVVNGDVINSIVDWLRPIIAGFMMLCLMFFNYRKIYKLIRNSEPFGGIAPGTSDFSTGISEYSDNYLKSKEIIVENLRSITGKGVK